MRLLAIDPGTYEVGLYDGRRWDTFVLGDKKTERPARLATLAEKLADVLSGRHYALKGPYDFVIYEEQFVRGGPATKALFGAVGIIECLAHGSGSGVMSAPQSTVRKWARGGSLLAPKDAKAPAREIARLAQPIHFDKMTEHEIDACCLWQWAQVNCEFE